MGSNPSACTMFSLDKLEKKVQTEAYRHLVEDLGYTFGDAERFCEKMERDGYFKEAALRLQEKIKNMPR